MTDYYKILSYKGGGKYGSVYECKNSSTNKSYAVKIVRHYECGITNIIECILMKSYLHPHLVHANAIKSTPTETYIFMDLALYDLAARIRMGQIPPNDVHNICVATALGLDFMHTSGFIHCDIKPDNVLIYADGTVRLSDFSLSVIDFGVSLIGRRCAIGYCAPEILRGEEWNRSIDIWSLGCLYYEVATSTPLISGISEAKIIASIARWRKSCGEDIVIPLGCYSRIRTCWHGVDVDLKWLILRMCSYRPAHRLTTNDILHSKYINANHVKAVGYYTRVSESDVSKVEKYLNSTRYMHMYNIVADIYTKLPKTSNTLLDIEVAFVIGYKFVYHSIPAAVCMYNSMSTICKHEIAQCEKVDYCLCINEENST